MVKVTYSYIGIDFFKLMNNCDALHDLVAFVHFKKREKHPWVFNTPPNRTTHNSSYRKTIENLAKHRDIKLVKTNRRKVI